MGWWLEPSLVLQGWEYSMSMLAPSPLLFLFILSTCCITVLDIPGFITRTAFWGKKVIQSGYDQLLLFRKLCFFPPLLLFFFLSLSFSVFHFDFYLFYISRTAIRDLHCCNGWFFWFFFTVVLCLQLVSMILLPANLDGPLCSSSMITGSVYHTSLHFFFTSMSLWSLDLGSVEISFRDDETRKN